MNVTRNRDFILIIIIGESAAEEKFNHSYFCNKGQTKEHAILAKTLGIK